jgi:glycosyltransferase involved in cell wall biosynthesis
MREHHSHILIFEPRVEGHHLSWLQYITEDFLDSGFKVTWATDIRPETKAHLLKEMSGLVDRVDILPVFDRSGKWTMGSKVRTMTACLQKSGARGVFLPNLDEIASRILRFALIGIFPPAILKGKISGVYHRPRWLAYPKWPLTNLVKTTGFHRLRVRGWFRHIYLLDEYLLKALKDQYTGHLFHPIPDPGVGDFSYPQAEARQFLGIPAEKFLFLTYGIPARRKGLHVVVRAMLEEPLQPRLFLLSAGRNDRRGDVVNGLEELRSRGAAAVMDRYISDYEEKLCFCACDAVLLPYIHHFGSSAILARAAAASKMVIASDEGLIARRVRDHHLGWLFPTEKSDELRKCLERAAQLKPSEMARFREATATYALSCSREAFRDALLAPYKNDKS